MELNICVCAWLYYVLFYQLVAFSPWIVYECFILHIQGGTWLSGLVLVPYDGICPGLLSEAAEHILDAILGLLKEIPLYSLQTWHSTGVWSWGGAQRCCSGAIWPRTGKNRGEVPLPLPSLQFLSKASFLANSKRTPSGKWIQEMQLAESLLQLC